MECRNSICNMHDYCEEEGITCEDALENELNELHESMTGCPREIIVCDGTPQIQISPFGYRNCEDIQKEYGADEGCEICKSR